MRLSIVTAICGANEITKQWIGETCGRCSVPAEVVIVENGATQEEHDELLAFLLELSWPDWTLEHGGPPLGSTKAFNVGMQAVTGDVVAMLHNDLMVREPDWDRKVLDWFEQHPETGVAGFHGSKGLGSMELYRTPYELHQLARGWNYSNMEDAESHGERHPFPLEVATLDGMSLIARREDLLAWGGLDERYVHHMYDHDLCLTARSHGRKNYMLPINVRHISGQTANASRYNDHFADRGRDAGIHAKAHADFYEKWRGTGQLPARVP